MKKLFTLLLIAISGTAIAQNAFYSVRAEAVTQVSPPQVKLAWKMPPAKTNGNITVYRKTQSSTSWGTAIATLPGTTTGYTDNSVTAGAAYEYFIYKDDTTQPYGYVFAGIEQPAIHNRGAILLLVDDFFSTSCGAEIATLMNDLSGDGWEVLRKDFNRSATVATVKSYIVSTAQSNSNLQAVYILGHIAVPYSGDLNPDGHNDHKGAWPADCYYGDLDGSWTDNLRVDTTSGNPLNHNRIGDGKFDDNYIPSDIDLQVGRVDFYDMPAFSKTEEAMMKSYLNKAHQYKTGALAVVKRALVDDNFKNMQEGFGNNGWRLAPLVGIDSVKEKDFITTLNTEFHQWAYGCGGGTYTSCGGVGTTANIAANDVKAIFTPVFGSYFGDWNYKNNFLRAPLCADEPSLATFWAARPNWFLHHMALGESIGYATRLSQNNAGYPNSPYLTPIPGLARLVTTALMGDPSLRTDYIKPVPSVTLANNGALGVTISWTPSPEPNVAGYYVYRSTSEFGEYQLRSGLVAGNSFSDSAHVPNTYWYMVRAAKLQTTPSGTYYNTSLGITQKINVGVQDTHPAISDVKLYPNPAAGEVWLSIASAQSATAGITLTDLQGRALRQWDMQLQPGENRELLNIGSLPAGMYMVYIRTAGLTRILKLAHGR